MSDQLEINYIDIPEVSTSSSGDEYVLDTEEGIYLIDYDDIIFTNENTTFASTVSTNTTNISGVSAQHDIDISNLQSINKVTKVYAVYYMLSGQNISGQHLIEERFTDLPLNFVGADNITVTLSSDACGVTETQSQSAFILPKGTYRCTAAASFATDAFVGKKQAFIMIGLHQNTPPTRALLISDLAYTDVTDNSESTSCVCSLDGFFYISKNVSISLKASCIGRWYIGDPPATVTWDDSTSPPIYNNWCAPIQLVLEQVSEKDTYNLAGTNYLT